MSDKTTQQQIQALEARARELSNELNNVKRERDAAISELEKASAAAADARQALVGQTAELEHLRSRLREANKIEVDLPPGCWICVEPFSASVVENGKGLVQVQIQKGDILAEGEVPAKEANEAKTGRLVHIVHEDDFEHAKRRRMIVQ